MARIDQALTWLSGEFSVADKDAFRRQFHPGGDMLLDACLSSGYCRLRGEEVVLTPMGHRRERANSRPIPE